MNTEFYLGLWAVACTLVTILLVRAYREKPSTKHEIMVIKR